LLDNNHKETKRNVNENLKLVILPGAVTKGDVVSCFSLLTYFIPVI
jgi:hypothetical protein